MSLPNGARAVVEIAKLRDYCLSPVHEDGKHKARVFQAALGLMRGDAEWLRQQLLVAAQSGQAEVVGNDRFGVLYVVDFEVTRGERSAVVRSGWIVRTGEGYPRLTTCYVRRSKSL